MKERSRPTLRRWLLLALLSVALAVGVGAGVTFSFAQPASAPVVEGVQYYYLARWNWNRVEKDFPYWEAPRADIALGLVDLRSLPQMGKAGGTPEGWGFFVYPQQIDICPIGCSYQGRYLGDGKTVDPLTKFALQMDLGLTKSIIADTPNNILWELLVENADPTGQVRWKPLRGSPSSGIKLYLAGKVVREEAFDINHPAWPGTLAVFQADYKQLREYDLSVGFDHYRRVLDAAQKKYRVSWETLLEGAGVPLEEPLPSKTTITDDFNRADSADLGSSSEGWSWAEGYNSFNILSNQVDIAFSGAWVFARAQTDLSSDDHYGEVDVISQPTTDSNSHNGVGIRMSGFVYADGDENMYAGGIQGWTNRTYWIDKWIAGTRTQLNVLTGASPGLASGLVKLTGNGSDLELFVDTVSKVTTTDSAITGALRTGIATSGRIATHDSFEAADLAAAAAPRRIIIITSKLHWWEWPVVWNRKEEVKV